MCWEVEVGGGGGQGGGRRDENRRNSSLRERGSKFNQGNVIRFLGSIRCLFKICGHEDEVKQSSPGV